jgi:hypothetical protein
LCSFAFASSKVSELTTNENPQLTDWLYWINLSGGKYTSNKILWGTLLDDTKGNGDTAYVWSADKIFDQLALKADTTQNLDDFGTPDDNTDLNASTTYHGLLPKLSNVAAQFLNGVGVWAVPAGAGDVSKVGNPANHEWGIWTGDGTIEGVTVTGSKVVCTDADGEPTACSNLTDLPFSNYATIESINTLAELETISNGGAYMSDILAATSEANFKSITNLEANTDFYAPGGTDVPVTDGGTGASSLTDGGVLLGSDTGAITAMSVLADGEMIVGDGTTDPVAESGATLRTSIGVGTGDSPQFTGIELGHATDNTLTASGGVLSIEGQALATSDMIPTEDMIEEDIFDADNESVSGIWTNADDVTRNYGTDNDFKVGYISAADEWQIRLSDETVLLYLTKTGQLGTASSADPSFTLNDSDGAGATREDKEIIKFRGGFSTTTEDAEVSDWAVTSIGSAVAGTKYTNLFWDGSDGHLYMGVLADYTGANPSVAPLDVADYESIVWDFNYAENTIGISSPVSGTTTLDWGSLNHRTTGALTSNYKIVTPQSKTYTTDDDSETIGTDITSSVLLVTGDNDSTDETVDLQDGTIAGQFLTVIAVALVDNTDDAFILDVETDSTCSGCPDSGIFTLETVGSSVTLYWTGTAWIYIGGTVGE